MSKEQANNQDLSLELLEDIENEEIYKKRKNKGRMKITNPDYSGSPNKKAIENFLNQNNEKTDLVQ